MKSIFKQQKVSEAMITSIILNVGTKLFSFIRVIIVVVFLGYSYKTDVYYYAISVLGLFLLFGNVFDTLGIPLLAKNKDCKEKYYHFLFSITLLLATLLSLSNYFLASYISNFSWGFDIKSKILLENILKLLSPYIFFSFIFHHFGTLFRFNRQYTFFYFGLLLSSFFYTLLLVIYFNIYKGEDVLILPISMSIGMAISAFFGLFYGLKYFKIGLVLNIGKESKFLFYDFLLLSISYCLISLFFIIDKLFGAALESTTITALSISSFVLLSIKGLMNFEHILMTPISKSIGNKKMVTSYLIMLTLLSTFISLFLFLNAEVIISSLLLYGAVSEDNIKVTITLLKLLSFSLPLQVLWSTVFRVVQVYSLLKINILLITFSLIINLLANYILVIVFNHGVLGIAISIFLGFFVLNTLSIYHLYKHNVLSLTGINKTLYLTFIFILIFLYFTSELITVISPNEYVKLFALSSLFSLVYYFKLHNIISSNTNEYYS